MRNATGTAPRAARHSAPCCSHESRTAPHAARISDYSARCCSHDDFLAFRTAPRADLKSFTRRSPFSGVPLHLSEAADSAVQCGRFQGPRTTSATLHRLQSSAWPVSTSRTDRHGYCTGLARCTPGDTRTRVTDRTSGNSARVKTLHGAHPLRELHLVHDIHHLRPLHGAGNPCFGTPMVSPQACQVTARRFAYDRV